MPECTRIFQSFTKRLRKVLSVLEYSKTIKKVSEYEQKIMYDLRALANQLAVKKYLKPLGS